MTETMGNLPIEVKKELSIRKETLNNHLAEFIRLKNECRWSEAWNQLIILMNYADESLKYSASLLNNLAKKMPELDQKERQKIADQTRRANNLSSTSKKENDIKKMIVIPKKQNIH